METFEQMALRVAKEITHQSELSDGDVRTFTKFATRIREELCKGQEPVAWMHGNGMSFISAAAKDSVHSDMYVYHTIPLYLHPACITSSNALPADMVLVPREPTEKMVGDAEYYVGSRSKYKAMLAAYEKEQK